MEFIRTIEEHVGKKANINLLPLQPGDVPSTWADVTDLIENLDYHPNTSIKVGIKNFMAWYRAYYTI
jgi:UDP-glucuronate 4-epimerase